jgi:response regulator NasT
MRPLRIAIADDEFDMREYLARALTRCGYEIVAVAENGKELVSQCERSQPDLVVTDLRMPELDGLSAVEEIWRARDVPVVFVSAFPTTSPSGGCVTHATVFLEKPVKLSVLQGAVETAHGKQRLAQLVCQRFAGRFSSTDIMPTIDRDVLEIMRSRQVDPLTAVRHCEECSTDPASPYASLSHWDETTDGKSS